MGSRSAGAGLLVLAALVTGIAACAASSGSATAPRRALDGRSHVFVIVLENREYDQVIGDPSAPYLNSLASRRALATSYFAITHPSLPNYLALIGGSTFGIYDDCTGCTVPGANLATQLSGAGIGWHAYMQGMPSRCFEGASSGDYAKKHNPFVYFPSITTDPTLCNRVVPGESLDRHLQSDRLAPFNWITPDLCNDLHDCSVAVGDRYMHGLVPSLLRHLGPHGFLVVTFDEGTTSAGCCGNAAGGRVVTILAGPGVRRRAKLAKNYTHYSLLRTFEDAFGLGHLRAAATARPLRTAFTSGAP